MGKQRQEFEAWVSGELSPRAIEKNDNGDYAFVYIQSDWKIWDAAWQAALAASQTCVAKPELPPLPEPTIEGSVMHEELKICYRTLVHFTADQMREYGQACADAAQRDKDGNHADDLRGWLDEAREQYEAQDVAFHACSLKLKHAEEELADLRAALSASGQTAQAAMPEELRAQIDKLIQWKFCMSYNDSYFGEPAGMLKCAVFEIDRIIFNNFDCDGSGNKAARRIAEMRALSQAPQPSQVAVKIENTDHARQFLLTYMREHFIDKTFGEYIFIKLAGDFAWNLASAISSRSGVDHA